MPGVARGAPAGRFSAHATWAEPGPWHSSHDTVSSAHVVAYRFVARSYRFRRSVEWHSAHWKFHVCSRPVQWRGSGACSVMSG